MGSGSSKKTATKSVAQPKTYRDGSTPQKTETVSKTDYNIQATKSPDKALPLRDPPPKDSPSSEPTNGEAGKTEDRQKTLPTIDRNKEAGVRELSSKPDEGVMSTNLNNKIAGHHQRHADGHVMRVVSGDFTAQCPSLARVVRIFVSSTFTDTKHERNWLMENTYPELKEFCQSRGYEFQIVDMRWGIRDEAQDDHMTTDICLRELEQCKKKSTGPCFMSLMSHKYGFRDFPRTILASEFDLLLDVIEDQRVKELLKSWFQLDKNAVPAIYVLQPISSRLLNVGSEDERYQKEAWDDWWNQNAQMHTALAAAAEKRLDVDRVMAYKRSVSDTEVTKCFHDCSGERVVWFHRTIQDIDQIDPQKEGEVLKLYRDLSGSETKDQESRDLLMNLENKTLKQNLPPQNIFEYNVKWEPQKGIDPEVNAAHKQYLLEICKDTGKHLRSLLEAAFNSRDQTIVKNPIYTEALQHMDFCQNKCEAFYGRDDSLKTIENYLKGRSSQPFVIYGPSGCGKTSLVAMAAKRANKILGGKAINVIRFIGTTPDSSTLHPFLTSVINQLRYAVNMDVMELATKTIKDLTAQLLETMKTVTQENKQIVFFFDSLDQFDPAEGARRLEWLGDLQKLPENVKVILSTLPDPQYEALPILKAKLKGHSPNFLEVPVLGKNDIDGILAKWLESARRQLTEPQKQLVLNAFTKCPLPLYLRLTFDEAVKWQSYSPMSKTVLESSVRGCIDKLFRKMEIDHGRTYVSKALGYLTASRSGLSEAELEDILSCDDDVLGDVYRYWTPPTRRLPPLLLVRMKRDLGQFVVNRAADGRQVFYWYHRQFIEAAQERYCSDSEKTRKLHAGMADFFAGTWEKGHPKPYTDEDGKKREADRHVCSQPLKQGREFNVRKLTNLPYHRVKAGEDVKLKAECLMNYNFLVAKIQACGLKSVLDDFGEATDAFPDDQELAEVKEALHLSQTALVYDIRTLSPQLLGRLQSSQVQSYPPMSKFLADCRKPDHIYLEPDRTILTSTGQQLVSTIADHTKEITALAMNKAGTMAVTCSEDMTIKRYDLKRRKVVRTISNVGEGVTQVTLACEDTIVVVNPDEKLSAWDLNTGVCLWTKPYTKYKETYVLGGPKSSYVLLVSSKSFKIWDTGSGNILRDNMNMPEDIAKTISFRETKATRRAVPTVGHEKWMVVVEREQKVAFLFDLRSMELSHYKEVLKAYDAERNVSVSEDTNVIDGLAMSLDGDTLYVTTRAREVIYIHCVKTRNLEVLHVKAFPGSEHDYWNKVHLDPSGKYLYYANNNFFTNSRILVWNVETGLQATAMDIPNMSGIEDAQTVDFKTVITITSSALQIWDFSRSNKSGLGFLDVPKTSGSKQSGASITGVYPTESPRYFLMELSEKNEATVLAVYDTALRKYVRWASHTKTEQKDFVTVMNYVDSWVVAVNHNCKLKLLDLRTMKVTTVLQGKVSEDSPRMGGLCVINGGTEMAVFSRGLMHLKIMNRQTGKTEAIIKGGQSARLASMATDKQGTVIAAKQYKGTILIFDPIRRLFEYEITDSLIGLPEDSLSMTMTVGPIVSDDGQYLFIKHPYRKAGYKSKGEERSIFVVNLGKRQLERTLLDNDNSNQHQLNDHAQEVHVGAVKLLDDHRILAAYNDNQVRMFDFKKGTLLTRSRGHIGWAYLIYPKGGTVLISHGVEEQVIRLWDAATMDCFAVYATELPLKNFHMLGPKSSMLLASLGSDSAPVLFTMKGKGSEKYTQGSMSEASFPEVFKGVKAGTFVDPASCSSCKTTMNCGADSPSTSF